MKQKVLLLLMAATVATFTGCGGNESKEPAQKEEVQQESTQDSETTEEPEQEVAPEQEGAQEQESTEGEVSGQEQSAQGALGILEKVWGTYEEVEKFAAMGGDMANPVDNAPGVFDVSDAENLDYALAFPVDRVAMIDECASLVHMMNANTFTGAAYHVVEAGEVEQLATAIKDNILNRQWMCGFPDKFIIVRVNGDYLVTAFGETEIMENFKNKLTQQQEDSEILFEEVIQ